MTTDPRNRYSVHVSGDVGDDNKRPDILCDRYDLVAKYLGLPAQHLASLVHFLVHDGVYMTLPVAEAVANVAAAHRARVVVDNIGRLSRLSAASVGDVALELALSAAADEEQRARDVDVLVDIEGQMNLMAGDL